MCVHVTMLHNINSIVMSQVLLQTASYIFQEIIELAAADRGSIILHLSPAFTPNNITIKLF